MYDLSYDAATGSFTQRLFGTSMLGQRVCAYIGKEKVWPEVVTQLEGEDLFGVYKGYKLTYRGRNHQVHFKGIIKLYEGFAVFETILECKLRNPKVKQFKRPLVAFPVFEGSRWSYDNHMLSYKSQAPFNYPVQWDGEVTGSLMDGNHSPLIMMRDTYETAVLSPLSDMLFGQVFIDHELHQVRCGLSRHLKSIAKGTATSFILVFGCGVNKTMDRYGGLIQKYHGVDPISKDDDVLLRSISYWTNAGSAYWYNSIKKKSYDETLSELKSHHERIGLSFGSYQLDSWWYDRENESYIGGIINWEPRETVIGKNYNAMLPFLQRFKSITLFDGKRFSEIQKDLGTPIGCHFKQISNESIYVKGREGDYVLDTFALPRNYQAARRLFQEIFDHPKWGLAYAVHDWLQWMEDHHKGFRRMSLVRDYFGALDDTLLSLKAPMNQCGHMTLQLCMTKPSMTMHSVAMKSVTTIRSTCDSNSFFIEGTKRWRWHLYASKLINTMGKHPFFDNRFSSRRHLLSFRSYSRFEMIWLALGCGPIGLGDPIGKENVTLLRKVVCQDGKIIKPDHPCAPLDKCYLYNPNKPYVDKGVIVTTESELPSAEQAYRITYVLMFSAHPWGKKVIGEYTLSELGLNSPHVLYDYNQQSVETIDQEDQVRKVMNSRKFVYHILAPILHGKAFIGITSKHLSGSRQLIDTVEISDTSMTVQGQFPDDGDLVFSFYGSLPEKALIEHFEDENHIIETRDLTHDCIKKGRLLQYKTEGFFHRKYRLVLIDSEVNRSKLVEVDDLKAFHKGLKAHEEH